MEWLGVMLAGTLLVWRDGMCSRCCPRRSDRWGELVIRLDRQRHPWLRMLCRLDFFAPEYNRLD